MGGSVHAADLAVVRFTAVGGGQHEGDTGAVAQLVQHHEQVGMHLLDARTATALAPELCG